MQPGPPSQAGAPPGAGPWPPAPVGGGGAHPPRRRSVAAIVLGILLALSVAVNVLLVALVVFGLLIAGAVSSGDEMLIERVVQKSSSANKIAVIRIHGIINEEMAERLHTQFERAREDPRVKAVILRINSPGGGLTASDAIYHDIQTLLADKPVVAAMDAVAASGGYYIACSARQIVAQRTTITGSIGVIAQFFFLKDLLKDKLGVVPVTLKRGEQKDWPNLFNADITEEQKDYILGTLMEPGYQQFVDVVADSRRMDRKKVLALATGRIFLGKDAKDHGLVDDVGYFDDAVAAAKKLAGVAHARVVEYAQPFSLAVLLGAQAKAQTLVDLNPEKLAGLASPKIMYLWTGN